MDPRFESYLKDNFGSSAESGKSFICRENCGAAPHNFPYKPLYWGQMAAPSAPNRIFSRRSRKSHNFSTRIAELYLQDVQDFVNWYDTEVGKPFVPKELELAHLQRYQLLMEKRGRPSQATVTRILKAVRARIQVGLHQANVRMIRRQGGLEIDRALSRQARRVLRAGAWPPFQAAPGFGRRASRR